MPETPLSEAAVYTTKVFSEGVYVGAGVEVTATAVIVEGTAVVGTGVETTVIVVGWTATVVAGGILVGGDVVQTGNKDCENQKAYDTDEYRGHFIPSFVHN